MKNYYINNQLKFLVARKMPSNLTTNKNQKRELPEEFCVVVQNFYVSVENCAAEMPLRMLFYEDKNTVCRQYDSICSSAGDLNNCHCIESNWSHMCM